jgi:cysteine-rich repeat protein
MMADTPGRITMAGHCTGRACRRQAERADGVDSPAIAAETHRPMTVRGVTGALAALALATVAGARSVPCPGGRFPTDIRPKGPTPLDLRPSPELVIAGDRVSLEPLCPPLAARIRPSRRGTTVRARWRACADGRRVALRALVDRACWSATGVVRARGLRPRFTATRMPACGNGVREGDEACDDGNTADGDCCSAACAVEAGCAVVCGPFAPCGPGAYCAQPTGQCGGGGTCVQRPAACAPGGGPVCGCDARTYDSACAAAAAGVSLADCDARCGTIAGIACPAGQFCDLQAGLCGGADLAGRCVVVPQICAQLYDPVCGCDGTTYGNDCDRQSARVQKAHDGQCRAPMPY